MNLGILGALESCLAQPRSTFDGAELYPSLIRHGMSTFSSRDVMRFLGKVRIPQAGGVDVRFNGEVVTQKLIRPEGVCLKHRLNRNTLKIAYALGRIDESLAAELGIAAVEGLV